MIALIRELFDKRELLWVFVYREFRVKYKQSLMGILWAIFMPALIVSSGILVRYAFSLVSDKAFDIQTILTVSVKSVPWAFIVSSIRFATSSLIGNQNLVTKIYFPRMIFPVSAVVSQGIDFAIAGAALALFLVFAGAGLSWHALLVPVLLLILVALLVAIGIVTSAASLFFRDVKYLVEVFLTFAIFFTPVFYEASMFGEYANLLMLNPFAPLLEGFRYCLVDHAVPPPGWIAYSAVIAFGLLAIAPRLFRRLEPAFAESI